MDGEVVEREPRPKHREEERGDVVVEESDTRDEGEGQPTRGVRENDLQCSIREVEGTVLGRGVRRSVQS